MGPILRLLRTAILLIFMGSCAIPPKPSQQKYPEPPALQWAKEVGHANCERCT
jgi:hypothetical protein